MNFENRDINLRLLYSAIPFGRCSHLPIDRSFNYYYQSIGPSTIIIGNIFKTKNMFSFPHIFQRSPPAEHFSFFNENCATLGVRMANDFGVSSIN